ncbi:iron-sulfur cluster biosynthesis family protein [Ornithinibacillus massiliensis]|uniref:Iron-sulfur cluster biosynthesis family protein n=1 Tax=Ornithinibacillus massiliensis TaxID=1944633 RepID=A0ABS5MCM2_9BACI|nr:iron-sulfur cluster biosynthesis family protein [Ornithinibacillus massiliensis]MBS3679652.1 iron-sulfur cluster biosynthesis family protein [Ornithinibacillus massiliensis]
MKLTITENAQHKLNELNINNVTYILLRYDTEGLGCGVNGMPTFRFVSQKEETHQEVENDTFPTIINSMQAVFFAEEMKLDYVNGTFRLSSPEGILNPFISTTSVVN